jgi:UDP:flavonoid glycosyltransferase YjiC (YdhE family)
MAGMNPGRRRPSPEQFRKAVLTVLSDSTYRQKAQALQADLAPLGPPFPQPRRRLQTIIADVFMVACIWRGAG